jgi:dTDP-4-amino-4,6-dideoxygalactose transaminase
MAARHGNGAAPGGASDLALADPGIGDDERDAVLRVLRSGWISMGPETAAFESEFAAALGAPAAVSVSSGTAALHLAMLALGLGPGDEVVVPSLTFVATAAAVLMVGAKPVFVDVLGPEEPTVDPLDVAAALTPRTRAIVAVHYGGWAARIDELRAIADASRSALVEDAAHAPAVPGPRGTGALGTVGDVGCFSFHTAKNLTTGEGGMIVARDPELLGRVRALRSHAMTGPTSGTYDVPRVGFNYRPTDLGAAIGRVQLRRLDREQTARRALTARYRQELADLPVAVPFSPGAPSAHHLMPVLLPAGVDRDRLRAALRATGIASAVHYPPVHRFTAYRGLVPGPGLLDRTEEMASRLLTLPLHGRLTPKDVTRVAIGLSGALAEQDSARARGADARVDGGAG